MDGSLSGEVAQLGDSKIFLKAEIDQRGYFRSLSETMNSMVFTPLHLGGSVVGVLVLTRLSGKRPFTEEDSRLLETLADYAAAALRAAQLLDDSRASREHVEQLIETAGDAIIMIDRECRITSWNKAAEQMFDYSASEVLGRSIDLLLLPGNPAPRNSSSESSRVRPFGTSKPRAAAKMEAPSTCSSASPPSVMTKGR